MALFQPCGIVPVEDCPAALGLRHQDLERQVERGARRGHHQRRSRPRGAEDQHLRRAHRQARRRGFAGVIDEAEEFDALLLEQLQQTVNGLIDRVVAGNSLNSFVHGRASGGLDCMRASIAFKSPP